MEEDLNDRVVLTWQPNKAERKPPHHPRCKKSDCCVPPPKDFNTNFTKLVQMKSAPNTKRSRIDRLTYSNAADEKWFIRNKHLIP